MVRVVTHLRCCFEIHELVYLACRGPICKYTPIQLGWHSKYHTDAILSSVSMASVLSLMAQCYARCFSTEMTAVAKLYSHSAVTVVTHGSTIECQITSFEMLLTRSLSVCVCAVKSFPDSTCMQLKTCSDKAKACLMNQSDKMRTTCVTTLTSFNSTQYYSSQCLILVNLIHNGR